MKKIILLSVLYIIISTILIAYTADITYIHIPVLCKLFISAIPFILGVICFKSKKNKITKKENIYLCIFSILMSLLLIYSFNIYKHNPPIPVEVELTTTHTKPEASKSYNFDLYSLKLDDRNINLNYVKKSGIILNNQIYWVNYNKFISNKYYPAKIQFRDKANQIFLIFLGNFDEDSGYAELKINNQKYKINTLQHVSFANNNAGFDSAYTGKVFSFQVRNNITMLEQIGNGKYLYVLSYFLIFLFSIYFTGLIVLNSNIKLEQSTQKNNNLSFFLYASPILIMGIFYLLIFYPAIMPTDCIFQWNYSHNNVYPIAHPVFHTYLIHLITQLWDSPTAVSLAQILSLSFIIGYFFNKLEKYSIPKSLLILTSVLIALHPYNNITLITLWKDVFFNIALIALIFCTFILYKEGNNFFKSKLNILIFIISLIFITLTRYNGIATAISYLILLFITLNKVKLKLLFTSISYIFLSGVILLLLYLNLEIQDTTFIHNQILQVPLHQISTVFHYNKYINEDDKKVLSEIFPLDRWENSYYKYLPHNLLFENDEMSKIIIDKRRFMKTYLNILKNNLPIMLKDYLIINSYILKYKINPEGFNYTQYIFTKIDYHTLNKNFGNEFNNLVEKSYFPTIKQKIKELNNITDIYELLYKPTIYFFIFLIFGYLFILKNGIKSLIILSPIILTLLFLAITLPEMNPRYVYCLFLCFPITILLSLLKIEKDNN